MKAAVCALLVAFVSAQWSDYTTSTQSTLSTMSATTPEEWYASSGPTASPSPSGPGNLGCGCNYSGLWLDVILVADSSSAMTNNGFQSMLNYIATALMRTNIGQGAGQKTRFGIVTYSDKATLRYDLTAIKNQNDLFDAVFGAPYEGNEGSNIEDGIRMALQEFEKNGKGVYSNRKKVIVVAASHYESGASTDPTQAAATFRGNGGILVTLEYVQNHGTTVPILDQLASNCSTLTNRNEDLRADDLLDVFCKANCFCAANWDAFSLDSKCYTPDQGCYFPVTIPAAYPLAARYCTNQNSATLASICDSTKALFLTSLLKNRNEAQWTGLSVDSNGVYSWQDKTPYSQCQPGANPRWYNGTASANQAVAQLSPSGFNNYFIAAPTFNDYIYTCQNTPCSSTLYCA